MNLDIIFQNENFIAINKPAGLLMHSAKGHEGKPPLQKLRRAEETTLADILVKKFPEVKKVGDDPEQRPGIVHRLDKDTSGIILVARNKKYFSYLKSLFMEHKIKKTYTALVFGNIQSIKGIINKPISLKHGTIKHTVHRGKMAKEAITEYEVLKRYAIEDQESLKRKNYEYCLVKAMPKTGRTHQIRVHMASIGHPIVGDILYGRRDEMFGLHRQFLHASSIEFESDPGTLMTIEAPLPRELNEVLNKLNKA